MGCDSQDGSAVIPKTKQEELIREILEYLVVHVEGSPITGVLDKFSTKGLTRDNVKSVIRVLHEEDRIRLGRHGSVIFASENLTLNYLEKSIGYFLEKEDVAVDNQGFFYHSNIDWMKLIEDLFLCMKQPSSSRPFKMMGHLVDIANDRYGSRELLAMVLRMRNAEKIRETIEYVRPNVFYGC